MSRRGPKRIPPGVTAKAQELVLAGWSCREVARELPLSHTMVARLARSLKTTRPCVCPCCKERVRVSIKGRSKREREQRRTKDPLIVIANMIEKIGCHKCLASGEARARGLG